jgi:hypothetical protein
LKDDDILQRIAAAAGGLCYPSERDAPLVPYRWTGAGEPTADTVCCAPSQGQRVDVTVEELTLEDFFEGLTEPGQSADPSDLAEAAAWRALKETIERELEDVRVYRCGEVDVDAYVLGRAPSGAWIGLYTHAVET